MKQKKFLIVDGYNVINDWENLSVVGAHNLGMARDMLIDELSEYGSFTGIVVEIVFDAYRNKSRIERRQVIDNVQIFYTKIHQTADSYIEKRTAELANSRKNLVFVATSDGAEQQFILGKGASRISSRELKIEIDRMKKKLNLKIEKTEKTGYSIGDVLDKKIVDALGKWREK